MGIIEATVTFVVLILSLFFVLLPPFAVVLSILCFANSYKKSGAIYLLMAILSGIFLVYVFGNKLNPLRDTQEWFHPSAEKS